ncbi:ferric-dicitrate binding protein FerR (iron transport regulator) [Filimonas zeae]|uniref:FecR family protein n=1 Tax=Filimonas zeae TaxID=1737353 RepID=A0A917IP17_9BACT|nr:FecR family protein [Filimonas zeae]MDR6337601.1 ferric-dicitrate binding protein FerR (iron transport regulator) [Filimonas zeae]GGH59398.1 hypothetical protein GCM10011379_06130 [Filimonas zeae]
MNIEKLGEIVERYLAGTATDQEKEWIEKWLHTRPEDARLLNAPHREATRSALWQSIAQATHQPSVSAAPATGRLHRITRQRWWPGYAAAAVLILICGSLWLYTILPTKQSSPAQTITALRGSHRTTRLPDSTVAHLFPGSTLTIPQEFNASDRRVAITGRVFFEVKTDASRPFYVQAYQLNTQVLGTSFEVMAQDSLYASVVVRTGKVGVQYNNRQPVSLTAGKRLLYDVQHQRIAVDEVNAAMVCEWWNHGMVFNQSPLAEVAHCLSNWYNIPIEITGAKWKQESVTIRLKNQSLTQALSLLAETLGFQYKQEKNRIIIY